jgi:type VII secretion protein EccB
MLSRVTGALVRAEPETSESPHRRDRAGVITGILLSVLLLGVAVVWALVTGSGGSTQWQQPRTLLTDATTGARYLLVGGQIRPVDDIASATLLAGGHLTPMVVTSSQLDKFPRGAPIGSGAGPQMLPAAALVNIGVWRACAVDDSRVELDIDAPASTVRQSADEALRVTDGNDSYLLWNGRRSLLRDAWVADVLGLGTQAPVTVPPSWLDLIPSGDPAAPPDLPGSGDPAATVAGHLTKVGQVFSVDLGNGRVAPYVMTNGGLAALTETEYLLSRARPGQAPEIAISASDLAAAGQRTPPKALTTLPTTPPQPLAVGSGAVVCLEYVPATKPGDPAIVFAPAPVGSAAKMTVMVPRGAGAVLLPHPDAQAYDQRGLLVDDRGIGYEVNGSDLRTLGYAGEATAMPRALVALIPTGPALSRPGGG